MDPFGRVFFPNLAPFRVEVGDTINMRVVKVRLAHAAEATCRVK